ncbi:MAG TPA: UDP-N-acetylmuramoyl-L-alanine--D-glutamate ligase [Spirochaetia bacterium]|nr:UDP-N-acetylmuramoyl-L-alanine--D-glutamate ligase [Spirochaetia bacterium]
MELAGLKVLVVGAGKSGLASANFLASHGAYATLTDRKKDKDLQAQLAQLDHGVALHTGGYAPVAGFDLVVTSPGVPLREAVLAEAVTKGIPLIGELELACRFCSVPMVAVTGTNGKTTTTTLIGEIAHLVRPTLVGGNIGLPLVSRVEDLPGGSLVVAEVSSFQLATTVHFRPAVAVVLNIVPDHLDWHGSMTAYVEAKARILANQTGEDTAVLNYDDPLTRDLQGRCRGRVLFFSTRQAVDEGAFVADGKIVFRSYGREEEVADLTCLAVPGEHNLANALAAVTAARAAGIEPAAVARGLAAFRGVRHRLETAAIRNGVRWVNDSKGTNPAAAITALRSFAGAIILIAGGRNKGSDFAAFAAEVAGKVRFLLLLGEAAPEIEAAVANCGFTAVQRVGSLQEAAFEAFRRARPGDTVLLSPACASWDMFRNYEERGDQFCLLARQVSGQ